MFIRPFCQFVVKNCLLVGKNMLCKYVGMLSCCQRAVDTFCSALLCVCVCVCVFVLVYVYLCIHIYISHVTCMKVSHHIYECVTSNI